jgi:hypothetical protein
MGHPLPPGVGSGPDQLPPELLDAIVPPTPALRRGRPFYEAELPLGELRRAGFPKLVISGGHHRGFEAMCADLAARIGGDHRVVEGAGHEIQFTGAPLNALLVDLWGRWSTDMGDEMTARGVAPSSPIS